MVLAFRTYSVPYIIRFADDSLDDVPSPLHFTRNIATATRADTKVKLIYEPNSSCILDIHVLCDASNSLTPSVMLHTSMPHSLKHHSRNGLDLRNDSTHACLYLLLNLLNFVPYPLTTCWISSVCQSASFSLA